MGKKNLEEAVAPARKVIQKDSVVPAAKAKQKIERPPPKSEPSKKK